MAPPLNKRHHAFIQSLMARGPISEQDAHTMFRELLESQHDNVEEEYFNFLGKMNKELDFLQMEIRASRCQYDGSVHYGLVNKLANEEAKWGTRYAHPSLVFFKGVMEAIAQDPEGSGQISSTEALNIRLDSQTETQSQAASNSNQCVAAPKMTLTQKQMALNKLIDDKWLNRTEDGGIALGIKAFLELRSVFKNLDVPFCDVCNEAGIKAMVCNTEGCTVRMHKYCAEMKFSRREVPRKCPDCKADWDCEGLDLSSSNISRVCKTVKAESSSVVKRPRRVKMH